MHVCNASLGRKRQEDLAFKGFLDYTVSLKTAWLKKEAVSKNKTNQPSNHSNNKTSGILSIQLLTSVKNPPLPGVSGIAVELKIFTLVLSLEIADFPENLGFSKLMCCEAYHDIHNIRQIEKKFSYLKTFSSK